MEVETKPVREALERTPNGCCNCTVMSARTQRRIGTPASLTEFLALDVRPRDQALLWKRATNGAPVGGYSNTGPKLTAHWISSRRWRRSGRCFQPVGRHACLILPRPLQDWSL